MPGVKSADDTALKVHVHNNRVWYLDGDKVPVDSGLPPSEFARSRTALDAVRVRAIGNAANGEILMSVYSARRREDVAVPEVCSPLAASSGNPDSVLLAARRWAEPPCRGGFHEFTSLDYPSYLIAAAVSRGRPMEESLSALKLHPAWGAWSVIPHLHPPAVCRLVADVIDPRFFIDLHNPDRLSKLDSFLGLEPDSARGGSTPDARRRRFLNVTDCWKHADPGAKGCAAERPDQFVWRAYYEAGGGWKGALSAGRRLIRFMRHTWLDALYPHRLGAEKLFAPDMFFDWQGAQWFNSVRGAEK